jgi:hypothetical protein
MERQMIRHVGHAECLTRATLVILALVLFAGSSRAETLELSGGFGWNQSFSEQKTGPIPTGDGWTFSGSASSPAIIVQLPAFNPALGTLLSQEIDIFLTTSVTGFVSFTAPPLPPGETFYEFDRANGGFGTSLNTNIGVSLSAASCINFGFGGGTGAAISCTGIPISEFRESGFQVYSPTQAVETIVFGLSTGYSFEAGNGSPFAADSAYAELHSNNSVSFLGRYNYIATPSAVPLPPAIWMLAAALGLLGVLGWMGQVCAAARAGEIKSGAARRSPLPLAGEGRRTRAARTHNRRPLQRCLPHA